MKASIMSSAALHALIDIYGRNFGEVLPSIDVSGIVKDSLRDTNVSAAVAENRCCLQELAL